MRDEWFGTSRGSAQAFKPMRAAQPENEGEKY
jgi:hypothetical protein